MELQGEQGRTGKDDEMREGRGQERRKATQRDEKKGKASKIMSRVNTIVLGQQGGEDDQL